MTQTQPVPPTIDELTVADALDAWSGLGFELEGDTCVVGDVRIRLAGLDAGRGLIGWSLRDIERTDLDATVAGLGDRVSEVRPAVQPGRRIATLRRSAGLTVPVALMTPSLGR